MERRSRLKVVPPRWKMPLPASGLPPPAADPGPTSCAADSTCRSRTRPPIRRSRPNERTERDLIHRAQRRRAALERAIRGADTRARCSRASSTGIPTVAGAARGSLRPERRGGEQRPRVRVARLKKIRCRELLDDLAAVHHRDPVRDLGNDRQIMAHQNHRHAAGAREVRAAATAPRPALPASSAVVGSSAMSSGGESAMAMAIATRCRWPPDSS
jgi:hypothetical protein